MKQLVLKHTGDSAVMKGKGGTLQMLDISPYHLQIHRRFDILVKAVYGFFFFAKGGRCVGDAVAKASAAVARAPDVFRRTSRVLRWRPPWSRVNLALFCVRCYGPALNFSDHASIIHGKIYRYLLAMIVGFIACRQKEM